MKRNLLLQYLPPLLLIPFILYSCREACDKGYEGKRCDVPQRDKFEGVWNAVDNPGSLTYTDTIIDGSDIVEVVISKNFSGNRYYKAVKATVLENTISIFPTDQKIDTSKTYAVGSGVISEDHKTINWNYTLTIKTDTPFISTNYTGVWTKQ